MNGNFIGTVGACDIEQAWNNLANNQIDPDDTGVVGWYTWYYNAIVRGYFELSSSYRYVLVIEFEERPYPADLGQVTMSFNHFGNIEPTSVSSNNIIDYLRNLPTYIWSFFSGGFNTITGLLTNLPTAIWGYLSGGFTSILNKIDGVGSIIWGGFSGGFSNSITKT